MNIKHIIKRAISLCYSCSGRNGKLIILTYHSVNPQNRYSVKPEDFEFQMKYLKDNFEIINLNEIERVNLNYTKPLVAIIFDDGYEDNYFYALPILKKLNIPATIAITTDFILNGSLINEEWFFYKDLNPLKKDQIKKMLNSGLINIASHGKTHQKLSFLNEQQLKEEVCLSKNLLEEAFSTKIAIFVYPFGQKKDFDPHAIKFLEECDYKIACTNM